MTKHRTIETSLSFDTIIRDFPTRAAAVDHAITVLVKDGDWPADIARRQVEAGKPCLVADDGDDWSIRIEAI